MRVLLLSTFEKSGGAAIAASRLALALHSNGIEAKMLVRNKQTVRPWVVGLDKTYKHNLRFVWERFCIWFYNRFSKKNLFAVSLANTGADITQLEDFKDADIIHIHWVNQGMLSLKDIEKIVDSGKPIVWTMHDMWNSTGICHHARECDHYFTQSCHNCFFIEGFGWMKEPSARVFQQKKRLYAKSRISFVACSLWLRKRAELSPLMTNKQLLNIPNPINPVQFAPSNQESVRIKLHLPKDKKLLLFGSMKVTDKRKGIDYMVEACRIFCNKYPSKKNQMGIVMMGNHSEEVVDLLPFPVYSVGFVSDENHIVELYNATDLYVTPSLEENLPNTIMEALSCGIPCVGFEIGGIPEMIDHRQNGYVATYKSAADLADGIYWSIFEAETETLKRNARDKVLENYSQDVVAKQYLELYKSKLDKPT
jgi:glycosyltransferase involved in cell wall biosynthesis